MSVAVSSFLRTPAGPIPVADVQRYDGKPAYVAGSIVLDVDGCALLSHDLWDDVDMLEASLLWTGTLAGWTSTRVDGSLTDLDQPTPQAGPALRSPPVPPPPVPPPPVPPPSLPSAAVEEPSTSQPPSGPPVPPVPIPARAALSHQVRHGETWWSLAERYLGDGGRASVLKQVNAGRPQPDGSVVDHKRPLRAGWTIEVPLAEDGAR